MNDLVEELRALAERAGAAWGRTLLDSGVVPPDLFATAPVVEAPEELFPPRLTADETACVCGVAGCDRPLFSRGLCSRHYQAFRQRRLLQNGKVLVHGLPR